MKKSFLQDCEKITKMNLRTQNIKLRFFSKVDLTTKLKILRYQKQIFHKIKDSYVLVDNLVLTFCSLILAINKIEEETDQVSNQVMKLEIINIKLDTQRNRLLGYWSIVRELKIDKKMSFRKISEYFLTYHEFKVSYSTIHKIWLELEENNNG